MDKKRKPLLVITTILSAVLIIFLMYKFFGNISVEDVLKILPENKIQAVIVVLFLFAIKSLTVIVPIPILLIAVGTVFPIKSAFLINMAGVLTTILTPYILGYFCNEKWIIRLQEKYPKINRIEDYRCNNQIVFIYITRAIGCLPGDIVSWYLGNRKTNLFNYIIGSFLGMLPGLIINTIFGDKLSQGFSLELFIVTACLVIVSMLLSVTTNLIAKKYKLKK